MTDKQLEKQREQWVYKHNDLIQNVRFDLSAMEQKIVLYMCSKISNDQDKLEWVNFKVDDFCEVIGIDRAIMKSGSTMRSYVKNTVKAMADKSFWIKRDGDTEVLCRWIHKMIIDWNKKTMAVKLDDDLSPYLIQLQSNYFQYKLFWVLEADSKYTIPLYELFKSDMWRKVQMLFEINELKALLSADKVKSYKSTGVFVQKCIEPAVKEINELTDIKVTYKKCKEGKSITHLQFIVRDKNSKEIDNAKRANEDKRSGQIHIETPPTPPELTNADIYPVAELNEYIEAVANNAPKSLASCKTFAQLQAYGASIGRHEDWAWHEAGRKEIERPKVSPSGRHKE